jgi:DhnA-type fructose-1,6-bisphosphate aldolase and related enzymes
MGLGIDVRLSRLFSHPSGNLFGIAVDHFVGYGNVREGGLANLPAAVDRLHQRESGHHDDDPGAPRRVAGPACGQASLIVQAPTGPR